MARDLDEDQEASGSNGAGATATAPSNEAAAGRAPPRSRHSQFSDDSEDDDEVELTPAEDSSDGNEEDEDPAPPNHATDRELSPDEMDKLVQLQSITGIEDLQICRALLESQGWDLEATAREQLGIPSNPPPRPAPQNAAAHNPFRPIEPVQNAPNAHNHIAARNNNNNHRIHQGDGNYFRRLFDLGCYIVALPVTLPLRIAWNLMSGIYGVGAAVFGFPPLNNGNRQIEGRNGAPAPNRVLPRNFDPVSEVRKFSDSYEALYGSPHPPFHIASYSQALEEAKKDLKFLVVYLHSPEHQDSARFCRRTLSAQSVCDFVSENNMIFWACSVELNEGYRVSQALRESTYPFLAVIVLRQNKMMMVGRIEGYIGADDLVARMTAIVRDNEAFIVAARAEREERQMNQNIRVEQDLAFQETLRQDQENERKKREAEEKKRREEEEEERTLQEERNRKDKIRKMKIDLVTEIPEEPAKDHPEALRVVVKLPEGQRLERRFLRSHSLKCLYFYVFCHPDSPDEFDITTNFPRKVLQCKPEDEKVETFAEAGFDKSMMLFVNDLEA